MTRQRPIDAPTACRHRWPIRILTAIFVSGIAAPGQSEVAPSSRPYAGPVSATAASDRARGDESTAPVATRADDRSSTDDRSASEAPASSARVRASLRDGFGIDSPDGRFGISFGLVSQLQYRLDGAESQVEHGFRLRLARPVLQGRLWGERLTFFVQPELAGEPRLLDATATVTIHPALAVQAGQYRPWSTRGFRTGLPVLALPGRGAVLDTFRVDRDVGLTVLGRPFDGRLEYYVGIMNGEGTPALGNFNPHMLYLARVVVAPWGAMEYTQTPGVGQSVVPFRLAWGLNAYTNETEQFETVIDPATGEEQTIPRPDRREVGASSDVAVHWWRLAGLVEGFWRRRWQADRPTTDAWGVYAELAGNLLRDRLDAAFRVGAMDLEAADLQWLLEPGVNVYIVGNHAKLQLRYRCMITHGDDACNGHSGIVQAQLLF